MRPIIFKQNFKFIKKLLFENRFKDLVKIDFTSLTFFSKIKSLYDIVKSLPKRHDTS